MDVVDTGTNGVGIGEVGEGVQQLHARAAGLDGDDIGVHGRHRLDDVVELRVTHVAVDLRGVAHATGGDAKVLHGPCQVGRPVGAAQRQAFAEGRLVDLDEFDAGRLQVVHLIA